MLGPQDRFAVRPSEVTGQVIDGEAIIMNLATGMFYSMDKAGAAIWEALERGDSCQDIVSHLSARYEVTASRAREDVERLIGELVSEGLVVPLAEPVTASAPRPESPVTGREPYDPPRLGRYSDMVDLLALDPPLPVLRGTPWTEPGTSS